MSFSTTAVRSVAVPGLLLLLALAAALSLTIGAKSLPIGTVFTAFSGTCQSADCTIVLDARLPRTLAGLLAGVALGLAGALMQTLTRNPLADPGLLGVNSGASFAIVLGAALFGITSPQEQLLLAFCGALCASLETALSAGLWNAGSLNGLTWGKTWPSAPLILLMLVGSALLVRRMRLLEMGDDTACALGVQVERSRLLLMLVAVVLTAASTALAGPISFIALVAPHIARRLSGTARWGLTQSALCGALLLALADYGAQRLFMPWQLPVGVLTVSLGGIYLIALLIQESRKK